MITLIWTISLVLMVLVSLASKKRVSLGSIVGVGLYLCVTVLVRVAIALRDSKEKMPTRNARKIPTSLLDMHTLFRLEPMEVVLGFDRRTPIKVDFNQHHTLIAGVTGFGKTYMIISILVQLFSRGARFTDFCDVYLFDYKADGEDFLHLWKPLLKGYYSISENSPEEAVSAIVELANQINGKPKKRILVIIDEVASISALANKALANDALMLLAGKLRSRGTLVVATQHPRYDIIPRAATINMSRKIAVHVDDEEQAKLIFRSKLPPEFMPIEQGEFTIKEPGVNGFRSGAGMKPCVPGDIEAAIRVAAPLQHADPMVKFLIDTIAGLSVGDKIIGINKRVDEARKVGLDLRQKDVTENYALFAEAGIFGRERRGQSYKLMFTHAESVKVLEGRTGE